MKKCLVINMLGVLFQGILFAGSSSKQFVRNPPIASFTQNRSVEPGRGGFIRMQPHLTSMPFLPNLSDRVAEFETKQEMKKELLVRSKG